MKTKEYQESFGKYSDQFARFANKTKSTRIIRFFRNADLRCMQDGLRAAAISNGIDPWELNPGEFLVFCNSAQTMLKIFGPGNIIASLKHPLKHRIDLNLIRYIPKFFNGTEFNYDGAMKKMLNEKVAA